MTRTVSIECTAEDNVRWTVDVATDTLDGVVVAPFTSTAKLEAAGVVVFNDLEKTSATFAPFTTLDTRTGATRSA